MNREHENYFGKGIGHIYDLMHLIEYARQCGNTHTLALGCIEAAKTRKEKPILVTATQNHARLITDQYGKEINAVPLGSLKNTLLGTNKTFVLDNWTVLSVLRDFDLYVDGLLRGRNYDKSMTGKLNIEFPKGF